MGVVSAMKEFSSVAGFLCMRVVVTYDVADSRRRSRLAGILKDFGVRVQESVFECVLLPDELSLMLGLAVPVLVLKEDKLRLYRLCRACEPKVESWGARPAEFEGAVRLV